MLIKRKGGISLSSFARKPTVLNNRHKKIPEFKTCAEIFKNEVLKLQGDDVYIHQ